MTEGDTLTAARKMAKDAIRAYIESLRKDGQPVPRDAKLKAEPIKKKIKIPIPA